MSMTLGKTQIVFTYLKHLMVRINSQPTQVNNPFCNNVNFSKMLVIPVASQRIYNDNNITMTIQDYYYKHLTCSWLGTWDNLITMQAGLVIHWPSHTDRWHIDMMGPEGYHTHCPYYYKPQRTGLCSKDEEKEIQ
jgi:hypothetical protein